MTDLKTDSKVDSAKHNEGATIPRAEETHREVFSNPHEYMSVLQNNFAQLSRGHDQLTLNDLKIDGTDLSLDPKVRSAAQIAYSHYNDLLSIASQSKDGDLKVTVLTKNDIAFELDMVDGKIVGHAVHCAVPEIGIGVYSGAIGIWLGSFGGLLLTEVGLGIGIAGAGYVLGGLAGLGYGAYEVYEGLSAYHRFGRYSKDDQSKISKWL